MRTRVRKSKSTAKVATLEDLQVEEVSIVDRPANKRQFLLVKNESGKGDPVVVNEDGKLTTDKNENLPTMFAAFSQFTDVLKKVDVEKRLNIPPDVRTDLYRSIQDVTSRLYSVMGAAESAQVDRGEGGSTLLPVLADELSALAKVIADTAKRVNAVKKNDPNSPEPTPEPTPEKPDGQIQDQILKLVEGLETTIEKAGAKMAKDRLTRFKTALDALAKVLIELENIPAGKAREKTEKADPTPPVQDPAVGSLVTTVDRLVEVVRKQSAQIRSLNEQPGTSNVIRVDTLKNDETADDDRWPMDMNSEKSW